MPPSLPMVKLALPLNASLDPTRILMLSTRGMPVGLLFP